LWSTVSRFFLEGRRRIAILVWRVRGGQKDSKVSSGTATIIAAAINILTSYSIESDAVVAACSLTNSAFTMSNGTGPMSQMAKASYVVAVYV